MSDLDQILQRLVNSINVYFKKQSFSNQERSEIYDQISARLEYGSDLQKLIPELAASAERFTPKKASAYVLRHWSNRMSEHGDGVSFAECIHDYNFIPPQELMLIASGAESGRLHQTLKVASAMLDTQGELKEAYVGAIFMPLVLVLGAFGIASYFGSTIIPDIIKGYQKTQFAGSAYKLIQFSDFLNSPLGILFLAGLVLSVVAMVTTLNKTLGSGPFRVLLEKIPPWSMYKDLQSFSFLSTLAVLLGSYSDRDALIYMLGDQNSTWRPTPYLSQRLEGAIKAFDYQGAANVADALEKAGYQFPNNTILSLLYQFAGLPNFGAALQVQADRLRARMLRKAQEAGRKLNLYGYLASFGFILAIFLGFFELTDQLTALAKV